ncbi:MAG: acyloxyacyl hydrolase [Taibaiella sp.]|nr:acyloxyacyl hydrolase [Taibaiella sp.]
MSAYICSPMRGRYPILLLLLLLPLLSGAQDEPAWAGFGVEVNAVGGKIFKHTPKFKPPIPDGLSKAIDINFIRQTYGTKDWQQRVRYPMVGFGVTYINYGIDSVYGHLIGFYPDLQIPIIRGKKLEWTLRFGFGIGFISKYYSRGPVWDTINNAMSSNINNFSTFTTDLRYRINKHWDVQMGANFFHVSNATYHTPNLGINMYGAHVGLRYFPVTSQPHRIVHDLHPLKSRWLVEGRFSMAFTESGPGYGPMYHVYLATLYASKRWHSKNKFFGGIDYSYHQDVYAFLRNNEILQGREAQNSWKSALFLGNEFGVGRFGIILQAGYYLREAYLKADQPFYEKIGTHIYLIQKEQGILKELYFSALLKTHTTVAELAEFGIGIGF